MSGLLDLAPQSSIPLVARFLTNPTENVVYEAAAALGVVAAAGLRRGRGTGKTAKNDEEIAKISRHGDLTPAGPRGHMGAGLGYTRRANRQNLPRFPNDCRGYSPDSASR